MVENREVKSDVFSMLMEDKYNALQVYNALNGSDYSDPELVEIVTLEKGISLNIRNDAAFIVDMNLNIYEHQSTYNPNMPIRSLIYLAEILKPLVKNQNIYGNTGIHIPTPHFAVFYNGGADRPSKEVLRLSDLFSRKTDDPDIEIKCAVYNINTGTADNIFRSCTVINEYMQLIDRVRYYELADDDTPIRSAIDWCINNHVLEKFLTERETEVIRAMTLDYTFERQIELTRRDTLAEGIKEGIKEGIMKGKADAVLDIINELGHVPDDTVQMIQNADSDTLSKWLKISVKCKSVDDFVKQIM